MNLNWNRWRIVMKTRIITFMQNHIFIKVSEILIANKIFTYFFFWYVIGLRFLCQVFVSPEEWKKEIFNSGNFVRYCRRNVASVLT